MQRRTAYGERVVIYIIGMLLLATGIILNTKTAMGVSPLVSIAFCVSALRGLSFANMTLVLYLIYFALEILLKGKDTRAVDFLQIPFCYVFTRCMNLISALLPDPYRLPLRILVLVLAILCTGFGAAIMVNARLIPNPADGLVQILSVRMHRKMGFAKNTFDATCVVITIVISILAARRLVGVGVGTVCAVLGIGRVVALCNRWFGERIGAVVHRAPIRLFDGAVPDQGNADSA